MRKKGTAAPAPGVVVPTGPEPENWTELRVLQEGAIWLRMRLGPSLASIVLAIAYDHSVLVAAVIKLLEKPIPVALFALTLLPCLLLLLFGASDHRAPPFRIKPCV